jgi:uncharacterized protein (DUF1778 family)
MGVSPFEANKINDFVPNARYQKAKSIIDTKARISRNSEVLAFFIE